MKLLQCYRLFVSSQLIFNARKRVKRYQIRIDHANEGSLNKAKNIYNKN